MLISEGFKTLTDDLCFKYVFSKSYILEDFINSFLEYIGSKEIFDYTKIVPESIILPNKKTFSLYVGDIIANSKDKSIISLEMYKNTFTKDNYIKSEAYMNRLRDNSIINNNYKEVKKVYSINLIKGNFRNMNDLVVNKYHFSNALTGLTIDNDGNELYLIRFDKVSKILYNQLEERFITWLRIINAKSLEEMASYIKKGDKIMDDIHKFVEEWNAKSNEGAFERYLEKEKQEAANKAAIKAEKNGREEGALEIAKNLLSLNISIEDITKATGLTEKQIRKLMD